MEGWIFKLKHEVIELNKLLEECKKVPILEKWNNDPKSHELKAITNLLPKSNESVEKL